jgi:oligopeptide transport system substrate-binding protein
MAVTLAACASGCTSARDTSESLLNRSVGGEPESLDIHKSASTAAARVLRDLGEGLLGYSASGELEPAAAERWEISADGLEYRFWLRPEARWSNGDPVTAEHFVFALQRLVDPATAAIYSQSVSALENATAILAGEMPVERLGVDARSEFELVIRLSEPVPYFLGLLTHPSMFPLHSGSLAEHGDAFARPGNHVTNGAYKLDSWQVGAVIQLVRNEHYRDNDNTSIDKVRYLFTPESMVEMHRYRAGELDITDNVPPEAFQSMREARPAELHVSPYLNVYYYGYNVTRAPFMDNQRLRRALSMAIDRDALTRNIIGRGEQPAYSLVPPGVNNYEPPEASFSSLGKDEREAKARQLYRDAGYSDEKPLEVEIRYNTSDTHRRIAIAIQSMWKTVLGVDATLINEDFQVLLANMRARLVTEVFRSSWSGDYNDAHSFLQIMQTDNPSNFTGYSSEEFDSLMKQAAQQSNPDSRRLYLEEAEKTILRDNPLIPLYFYVSKHMVSPRVQGWQDNVLDYHYSRHLSLTNQPE